MMTEKEKLKLCMNCRDDFYNIGNHSNTGRCWLFPKAKPAQIRVVHKNKSYPDDNTQVIYKNHCWHNPRWPRWGPQPCNEAEELWRGKHK